MTDGSNDPSQPSLSADGSPPAVQRDGRLSINEDWAATLFGLVLLLLVLAGVITGQFMKGLVP